MKTMKCLTGIGSRNATGNRSKGILGASLSYDELVLAMNPVFYRQLTETLGTSAADATGNGHAGTYARNVTLMGTELSPIGDTSPSFSLGDGDSVLVAPTATPLASMGSVSFWAYIDDATINRTEYLLNWTANGSNYGYIRKQGTSQIRFVLNSGGVFSSQIVATPTSAEWHNYIMTWEESGTDTLVKGYIDGVEVASFTCSNGVMSGANLTAFGIAASDSGATPLQGSMSRVMYINRLLTADEIATLATN